MDQYLIAHCAPTLAGVKASNLFNYQFTAKDIMEKQVKQQNRRFNKTGIFIEIMSVKENTALILVYRYEHLKRELNKPGVIQFLSRYGYQQSDVSYSLKRLKHHLQEYAVFPHEIGIFLGYPLEDVIGFVENEGRNCVCCGCWKVYGNECNALRLFDLFEQCKKAYKKQFSEGKTLEQLIVAA